MVKFHAQQKFLQTLLRSKDIFALQLNSHVEILQKNYSYLDAQRKNVKNVTRITAIEHMANYNSTKVQ